ncbi:MAG: biotin--[acetyl-CoA-carboxylase] ligase [Anaerolineales bacterium]
MDNVSAYLRHLPLGGIRIFERIGSTMDEAAAWLQYDAPDLALVFANEQTQGRGRLGRKWFTPPNSALAFSLILRPQSSEPIAQMMLYSGLAAVSICEVLENHFDLKPQIKWPNDILLNEKKTGGILIEAHWQGDKLIGVVIGVGINVAPSSVPPISAVLFPATCVEECLPLSKQQSQQHINRYQLLAWILERFLFWRPQIHTPPFKQNWEARLAYKQQKIQIFQDLGDSAQPKPLVEGFLMGINEDGSLRIQNDQKEIQNIYSGEISLRVK